MAPRVKSSSSRAADIGTHVALLRGINVGGKNKIKMTDLVGVFEDAGCVDVRTYIQSGNVVFGATPGVAESVPNVVPAHVLKRFGLRVPVVVRSAAQMQKAVANNPYSSDEGAIFVGFLSEAPTRTQIAALDPARSPGDVYEVKGGEIFMNLATGAAGTKLTNAYFDGALKSVCTVRNLRTVTALVEMAAER